MIIGQHSNISTEFINECIRTQRIVKIYLKNEAAFMCTISKYDRKHLLVSKYSYCDCFILLESIVKCEISGVKSNLQTSYMPSSFMGDWS